MKYEYMYNIYIVSLLITAIHSIKYLGFLFYPCSHCLRNKRQKKYIEL